MPTAPPSLVHHAVAKLGKTGAAALLGNMEVESPSFALGQRQHGGPAVGPMQMEPPMRADYNAFLSERGAADSLEAHVDYFAVAVSTGRHIGAGNGRAIATAMHSGNVEAATQAICGLFFRPGAPHIARRLACAAAYAAAL